MKRVGALVAVLGLAACHPSEPTVEVAGFALTLPVGKVTSTGTDETGSRTIELTRGAPATVVISWQPSPPIERAGLDSVGRTLADQLGAGATYVIQTHERRDTIEAKTLDNGTEILATFLPCGHRVVRMQTTAAPSTATELQDRMLRSFACHAAN